MRKSDMKWNDALSALFGTVIDQNQGEVWQVYLRELNTTNAEIIEAIEKAVECDLKPKEWRVTVTDLIRWVKALRSKKRSEALNGSMDSKEMRIGLFKQKAIGLFTDGYSKEYLIDEAWGLHGLTDDEINGLVAWVEELTKGETK